MDRGATEHPATEASLDDAHGDLDVVAANETKRHVDVVKTEATVRVRGRRESEVRDRHDRTFDERQTIRDDRRRRLGPAVANFARDVRGGRSSRGLRCASFRIAAMRWPIRASSCCSDRSGYSALLPFK